MNIFFLPNGYCMLRKEFPVPVFKNLVCEMTRCYVTKWFFSGQGERSAMHQTASKTTETEEDGGCKSHFHDCLLNINADCWNVWLLEDEVDRAGRQRNHAIWKKNNNNTVKNAVVVLSWPTSHEVASTSLNEKQTRLHLPAVWKQDSSHFTLFIKTLKWHITDCMLPRKCSLSPQDGIGSVTAYGNSKSIRDKACGLFCCGTIGWMDEF